MTKKLWSEGELILARCYNFKLDIDTGVAAETSTIEAEIKITSKRAMFEFIKLSFKNFSESPFQHSGIRSLEFT